MNTLFRFRGAISEIKIKKTTRKSHRNKTTIEAEVALVNTAPSPSSLAVGDRVQHSKWGRGVVTGRTAVRGLRGPKQINLLVKFENGGPICWAQNSSNSVSELDAV